MRKTKPIKNIDRQKFKSYFKRTPTNTQEETLKELDQVPDTYKQALEPNVQALPHPQLTNMLSPSPPSQINIQSLQEPDVLSLQQPIALSPSPLAEPNVLQRPNFLPPKSPVTTNTSGSQGDKDDTGCTEICVDSSSNTSASSCEDMVTQGSKKSSKQKMYAFKKSWTDEFKWLSVKKVQAPPHPQLTTILSPSPPSQINIQSLPEPDVLSPQQPIALSPSPLAEPNVLQRPNFLPPKSPVTTNTSGSHCDKDDTGCTEICVDSSSNTSASSCEDMVTKGSKKSSKQKMYAFKKSWTDEFKWLSVKKAKQKVAFCNACSVKITARKYHLLRHQEMEKHIRCVKQARLTPSIKTSMAEVPNVDAAEEKIAMYAVEHNIAFNSMDHLVKLIKDIALLPKNHIEKISCGRTKAAQIVRDRFGPSHQSNIARDLKKCHFSILLDESTDVSSRKSLAVVVRYYHKKLETQFLCLIEMPEATAAMMFQAIQNKFKELDIPMVNIIGFGADNAAVMMGSVNGLKAKFKELNPWIFVMGCICHSLALCSSHAAEVLPDTVEQFCHDIFNHFAHSSKRTHVFEKFQAICNTEPHAILRPVQTRWLSLKMVVNRILEQYEPLSNYFNTDAAGEKMTKFSVDHIRSAFNNPIYRVYLEFLKFTLDIICKMNLEYQSNDIRIHQLLANISAFYLVLIRCFIKKEVIDKSTNDLHSINTKEPRNYKPLDSIYFGPGVQQVLLKTKVNEQEFHSFKLRALEYYVELTIQIKSRVKFDDPVLKNLNLIDPASICNQRFDSIVPLAQCFPNIAKDIYELDFEYRQLMCTAFTVEEKLNIEKFWSKIFEIRDGENRLLFPHMTTFVKAMLSLPHSTADVERVFSKLNLIKTKTRNRLNVKTCESIILSKGYLKCSRTACFSFKKPANVDTYSEENNDLSDDDTNDESNILLSLFE